MDQIVIGIGIGLVISGVAALVFAAVGQGRDIRDLQGRVKLLEDTARKCMPHEAQEEIEHGLAALVLEKMNAQTRLDYIDNAVAHFQRAVAVGRKKAR
jgi:gas vesicle protein